MKKYEMPEIEVIKIEVEDVITTSGDGGFVPGNNQTPIG